MRKPFTDKIMQVHETVEEAKTTARNIGAAAESQVTLNIALTAVCVTALLIAAILVRGASAQGASCGH